LDKITAEQVATGSIIEFAARIAAAILAVNPSRCFVQGALW
jgi:hypothetical protein